MKKSIKLKKKHVNPEQSRFEIFDKPRTDVTSSPHEGPESEPETVEHREVICEGGTPNTLLNLPLIRAEPTDEEQNETDSEVRKYLEEMIYKIIDEIIDEIKNKLTDEIMNEIVYNIYLILCLNYS